MNYTPQDLVPYFKEMEKELKRNHIRSNMKKLLAVVVVVQVIIILVSFGASQVLSIPNYPIYSMLSILSFFSIMAFSFHIFLFFNGALIENKDTVNLYDGLIYFYREKQKEMNDVEFKNFIDTEYEKIELKEIIDILTPDREASERKKAEIHEAFKNKQKMVSAKSILMKDLNMRD